MAKFVAYVFLALLSQASLAQLTLQQAQSAGTDLANSMPKDSSAIVQSGVGSSNVMGDQFTGSAPSNLTNQSTSGSLFNVGNTSRIESVGTVTSRGTYSEAREDQADDAVHFLNQKPVLKPQLSANDPMLNPNTFGVGQSPFASSLSQECEQVVVPGPDIVETEYCTMSYNPYVYTCGTGTNVNFIREAHCPPGRRLERITRNICSWCIDPWIVLDVFCGATEGTYRLSSWTSSCGSGDCPYGNLFSNRVIAADVGSSQDLYLGNFGQGCNFPLYYRQNCSATHCVTDYSLRNSTCNGRDFSAPGRYDIPFRDVMNETNFNNCTAAEQLGG